MIPKPLRRVLQHQISQNVVGLSWVQLATFIVPLLTLPYVSRVLGPSQFGLVIFAQGFSLFVTLIVDWGFTPYGTRAIAADRNDPEALASTVAHIRGAQLLMSAASAPIALGALILVPKFHDHPAFLVLAWVAGVASAIAPVWFFVAVERVRPVAIAGLAFRVVGAALTFLFVRDPGDALIVLALFAASSLGWWTCADVMLYRRVPFRLRGVRAAALAVRDSGRLFVGTVGASLYGTFNVVLLGLYVPSAQVAQFGVSERVLRSTGLIVGPIATAVYPRLAFLQASARHDRARRLAAITLVVGGGACALLAVVLAVFAPTCIRLLFGPKFVHDSVPLLRILVLLIPINVVGGIAVMWLMTLHRDRALVRIVVGGGLLNVVLGSILSPRFGARGMAWSVLISQSVVALAALIVVYRIGDATTALFSWRFRRASPVEPARPEAGSG